MIDLDTIRAVSERVEVVGDAVLVLGDCRKVMPLLPKVDHIITDPPYSERTHKGHDDGARKGRDNAERISLNYGAISHETAQELAQEFSCQCGGWIVWMTDHTLAPTIMKSLEDLDRYVFSPLPFHHPGRSVRLTGDGPSSWTDWIIVSRTAAQHRWGTLPGGYVAGKGWNDKGRMGGKPTHLMTLIVGDYSRKGELVMDPFMGAGTTGVACLKEGRRFIGIEIDPEAFETSLSRITDAHRQPNMWG